MNLLDNDLLGDHGDGMGIRLGKGLLWAIGVLERYNRAPAAPVGDTELKPLNLSVTELAHLEAFLRGLSGPLKTPPELR
jgi:hypothetical protein